MTGDRTPSDRTTGSHDGAAAAPVLPHLRPFRPQDTPRLEQVCVRTADLGADATGMIDDDVWPALFLLPYLERHPDLAFVIDDGDGAAGYVIGTPDTDTFESWFAREFWPRYAERWPRPEPGATGLQEGLVAYGYERGSTPSPFAEHPAHLHIDLLPHVQGHGWGRRLIAALTDTLRDRGVTGLHLTASARNAGAVAFYPRVGFTPLPSDEGSASFGMLLR